MRLCAGGDDHHKDTGDTKDGKNNREWLGSFFLGLRRLKEPLLRSASILRLCCYLLLIALWSGSTEMTLERIKEYAKAAPFRPFTIETTGGTQIEIVAPDYIMFAPEDRDLVVAFDRTSRMFLVTTDQVASISLDTP